MIKKKLDERPSQSLDFEQAVHARELKQFCKKEWAKILFQFLLLKVTQSVIRLKCQLLFRIDTGRFG